MSQIFPAIILGIIGGAFSYVGLKAFNTRNLIQDLPTSKIRSLAVGLCEIKGKAIPQNAILKSPFSNQDCIYYHITIEEFKYQGKSKRWVTILDQKSPEPFLLQDETGSIQINPTGAEIELPINTQYKSDLGIDPPKQIQEYFKNHNNKVTQLTSEAHPMVASFINRFTSISYEGLLGKNKTMQYTERYIKPNEELYILGQATIPQPNSIPTSQTRNKSIKLPTSTATQKLIIQLGKKLPFVISHKKENSVSNGYLIQTAIFGTIGILLLAGSIFFLAL